MKITRYPNFFAILFFALLFEPAFVFGETVFFDSDGNAVDQAQYEQIASDIEKTLRMELKNGYRGRAGTWKDPLKLRKERIEQWKMMRSKYHPDSLPMKIEDASTKVSKRQTMFILHHYLLDKE
jgi:hypothetical protein